MDVSFLASPLISSNSLPANWGGWIFRPSQNNCGFGFLAATVLLHLSNCNWMVLFPKGRFSKRLCGIHSKKQSITRESSISAPFDSFRCAELATWFIRKDHTSSLSTIDATIIISRLTLSTRLQKNFFSTRILSFPTTHIKLFSTRSTKKRRIFVRNVDASWKNAPTPYCSGRPSSHPVKIDS